MHETHLSLDCKRDSSIRDMFLSKTETIFDDIKKLSRENLISQLMNSNDIITTISLQLIVFISSCFEIRDKVIKPFLEYWINFMIYLTNRIHVAVCRFSNRSRRTSKCGKNICDKLGCALCATFLFLYKKRIKTYGKKAFQGCK